MFTCFFADAHQKFPSLSPPCYSLKNLAMDRHKKKADQPSASSSSPLNGTGSVSAGVGKELPPAFLVAPKVFERRASAEPTTITSSVSKGLPPKMSKSPEPIVTEPDSPMPLLKSRYGSQDGLLNGRSQTSSPLIERSHHHQSSTQSVTVQQRRQYQEIVDGPNGRQVLSYSADRQNSQSKESQITSSEVRLSCLGVCVSSWL